MPEPAILDLNAQVSAESHGRVLTGVGVSVADLQQTAEARPPAHVGAPEPGDEVARDAHTGQFKPERPSRGAKRFQELDEAAKAATARAERAETERESLRQELETAKAAPVTTATPVAPVAPVPATFRQPKPTFDDFVTADDPISAHAEAVATWAIAKDHAENNLDARIAQRIEADRAEREVYTHVRDVMTAGAQAYKDFDAVLAGAKGTTLKPEQLEAVFAEPHAEHLIYALCQHPTDLAETVKLSPIEFGKKLARLIPARSVGEAASTARPVAQTNAPPPIQPVGTSARTTRPSLEELAASGNYADYKAARQVQLGR